MKMIILVFSSTNSSSVHSVPFFNNSKIPQENFFAKMSKFILDSNCFTQLKSFHRPLPALGEEQLFKMIHVLSDKRTIFVKASKSLPKLEVTFTLAELFNHLLSQNTTQVKACIEKIELVGGGVPWVLNRYPEIVLKSLGIENPEEWLSEELHKNYARLPRDIDFRLHAPNATPLDIQNLRNQILSFFVKKVREDRSWYIPAEVSKSIEESGLTVFSSPTALYENLFSTLSEACGSLCLNKTLEGLLTLRQTFAKACNAPMGLSKKWKSVDLIFISNLASSTSIFLKLEALKVYIQWKYKAESEKIILFLLDQDIPEKELVNFQSILSSYLSSSLENKNWEHALRIFQHPRVGKLLEHHPSESFNLLRLSQKHIKGSEAISSEKFNECYLKHFLTILPFIDVSELISSSNEMINYLDCLVGKSLKSEIIENQINEIFLLLLKKLSSIEIEKAVRLLRDFNNTPSSLLMEMGCLMALQLLMHRKNELNEVQTKHVFAYLRGFFLFSKQNNYYFTCRVFEKIIDVPLSCFIVNQSTIIFDLFKMGHEFISMYKNNSNSKREPEYIERKIQMLSMIHVYYEYLSKKNINKILV